MSISGIGSRSALGVQSLVDMRRQLDDLQRQLSSGKKSTTYAGIGLDRGLTVGLRNRLSAIESFQSSITHLDVRINLAQTALGRLADIGHAVKSAAFQSNEIGSSGATVAQSTAYSSLDEMLGLLNTQVGDRYIFSGSGTDQPSVATLSQIMDGDGARAGFKQIVSERRQADVGANGLGRLAISKPTPTSVQVDEDVAGSPFGLKLSGINASMANATVAGAAPTMSVEFTGLPNAGDTVQFQFTLPDGSSEIVTLTAAMSATPGPNEFTIGATADATADNLQTALTTSVGKLAGTSLVAASALAAADNFFNGTPQRVDGPPFDSATGLIAGTPANTVSWYTGENGSDPARSTATARIDTSITVSYGMRANEEGVRFAIQNVAALAAMIFPPGDPDAEARSAALRARVGGNLDAPPGTQSIEDIQSELAGAHETIQGASERHRQAKSTLAGMLEQIEGVPPEQVAAEILALQTRLQASLQTTAMLYQISLVNYL
ncbi:MAG: flagellar biosynthesis protein FlgL [Rhizobiales bacterium]|nr:flagellar biosynthesis protein FlgL [Hyphomicrobiales bacterium]